MPSTTAEQKKQLRKSVRSLLTALSPEERAAGDRAMFQAFLSLPEVRQASTFFLFWGIAGLEPDTGSLAASLNSMLTRIESSFHEQEETTDKMKRFVSDASHELRTPLAAIHGYAELYKMQRDMPGALERADESIEHIERSSQRMTVLVEDLLSR